MKMLKNIVRVHSVRAPILSRAQTMGPLVFARHLRGTEGEMEWKKPRINRFVTFEINIHIQRYEFDTWVRKIPLEGNMATDSSILAWRIPYAEEPGGLLSIASQRATHD